MLEMDPRMLAHTQQEVTTMCHIWKINRRDGLVVGYTDLDVDLIYEGVKYYSLLGFSLSAVNKTLTLSVDNLELKAPLGNISTAVTDVSTEGIPMFTEADIKAGLWDYGTITVMRANWADLTMKPIIKSTGSIGNISTGRNLYTAEGRGLQQPLNQTIGRKYTSACQANFGDENCGINKALFTFEGTVNRLIDQHSWIDNGLNQTNSEYTRTITGMTKASPIIVTSPGHGLSSGEQITFSGVNGMYQVNGFTKPITYLSPDTFSVEIDATVFADYTNGGTITKVEVSEYFKDGIVEWVTGNNKGLKMGVKKYSPNYVCLYDEAPFEIKNGDQYKITAGCDKLDNTCFSRFNNIVNFYGFNSIPGPDRMMSGT